MNRSLPIASLVVLTLSLGLMAQEEAEVIKFSSALPAVGDFQGAMTKSSNNTTIQMNRDGEEMPERSMSSSSTTKRDATILAVVDGKVTEVKLHWREVLRDNNRGEMGGGGRRGGRRGGAEGAAPMPEVTELAGQTLILDLSGATPSLKTDGGESVDEGLTRLVTRMETHEGKFSGWSPDILTALGKSEFKVGEVIPLTRAQAQKVLGQGERRNAGRRGRRGQGGDSEGGAEATDSSADEQGFTATLTFTGKRSVLGNDCGHFAIKVVDNTDNSGNGREVSSTTTLTGEMILGIANGWLYKLEMKGKTSGDMSVTVEQGSFETSTMGDMDMLQQVLYGKAKPAAKE